jgi:protoporphyrinogen oxidase
MSKIENLNAATAAPVKPQGNVSTVGALEGLAGFAEDINNQNMDDLANPEVLKDLVRERFGNDVTVEDVSDALEALRDISIPS